MPIVNVPFDIPDEIFAGIMNGDLTRFGGVVRDQAGAIVTHLKDALPTAEAQKAVSTGAAAIWKNPKLLAIGLGAVAVTVGGVALFKAVTSGQKQPAELEQPDCVKRFTASLGAYLDAAREGRLGPDDIDRLITDLDVVETEAASGRIEVSFSLEQWRRLVDLVGEHTRRLAAANPAEASGIPELAHRSDGNVVVDLRRHLEAQKRIFKNAA